MSLKRFDQYGEMKHLLTIHELTHMIKSFIDGSTIPLNEISEGIESVCNHKDYSISSDFNKHTREVCDKFDDMRKILNSKYMVLDMYTKSIEISQIRKIGKNYIQHLNQSYGAIIEENVEISLLYDVCKLHKSIQSFENGRAISIKNILENTKFLQSIEFKDKTKFEKMCVELENSEKDMILLCKSIIKHLDLITVIQLKEIVDGVKSRCK